MTIRCPVLKPEPDRGEKKKITTLIAVILACSFFLVALRDSALHQMQPRLQKEGNSSQSLAQSPGGVLVREEAQ